MKKESYPILEFDRNKKAILEPTTLVTPKDVPEHCVLCFFHEVIANLVDSGKVKEIWRTESEMGQHLLYEMDFNGQRLAVFHPGIGSAFSAALFEGVIAVGCNKFIACGGAGNLDSKIVQGHLIIPVSAVRDEGASYHYLPPSREVKAEKRVVKILEKVLKKNNCNYLKGKTWTTAGFYRETSARIKKRQSEGCLCVEMEAAGLFAVAKFRNVSFGQILYSGDDVSGPEWDSRNWKQCKTLREDLFWLAAEACIQL